MDGANVFSLTLPPDLLRPLVAAVVREVVEQLEAARAAVGGELGRISYGEQEAARMLGLKVHQLADERRRGRISASRIVRGRIAYLREDLVNYLMERRIQAA
jgi:Helix-turn-helix domain